MLYGLYLNKEVLRVGAVFAFGFIQAIRFLEKHWSLLSRDIRTGSLNPVVTDPSVKESVMKMLKPDPNLVDYIELECSKNRGKGLLLDYGQIQTLVRLLTQLYPPWLTLSSFTASGATMESEKGNSQLVNLADVKPGEEYELVVTTYAGLYRCRVGHFLKVVGFKNKAPQFSFICRKNVALSMDSDKTDEVELHKAVENAVNHLVPFSAPDLTFGLTR
ncbi:putative GH3 family protein [Helianthus annuus]|nr:putative GH3 family protein [Helianthus annuus]